VQNSVIVSYFRIFFIPLACSLLLTHCSHGPPGSNLKFISISTTPKLNERSAIKLDLVVVYNEQLFEKLQGLSSEAYYKAIPQIRRDNDTLVDIWRWEMVPNQFLNRYTPVFPYSKAWGVLFFAKYKTPGVHRAGIGSKIENVEIVLGEKEIEIFDTSTKGLLQKSGSYRQIYPKGNVKKLTDNDEENEPVET
jgi:type VI secretion system protein